MYIKELKRSKADSATHPLEALVTKTEKRLSANGKTYHSLTLQDRTDELNALLWSEELDCQVGDVVGVMLKIKEYNGNNTYSVDSIQVYADRDPKEFDNSIYPAQKEMVDYLNEVIKRIQDPDCKVIIDRLFKMPKSNLFYNMVAAKTMHHDKEFGLLFHTTSIMKHAVSLIRSVESCYPGIKVNRDYVLTAILLHDFFKVEEYTMNEAKKGELTNKVLIGHITMAAQFIGGLYMFEHKITERAYTQITHIVNSHHGLLEYGSPTIPATIEAYIVSTCDMFDSRINMFAEEYNKLEVGELSPQKNFGLGTVVYKA